MKKWTNRQQTFGDIFLEFVDEFKSYHHYITNYNNSIETLVKTRQINPAFDQFLIEAKMDPRCNLLSASDFLIMPIQRLPRYELLLSDLLKYTEENNADYNHIKQSLNKVKETTSFLNNLKRAEDSKLRLTVIERKVIGTKVIKNVSICVNV
jgi:hypothetical protein